MKTEAKHAVQQKESNCKEPDGPRKVIGSAFPVTALSSYH